jgi:hypothetical protein
MVMDSTTTPGLKTYQSQLGPSGGNELLKVNNRTLIATEIKR